MSWRALQIGTTGLGTQAEALGVRANNLANLTTPGFRRQQAVFADAFLASLASAGPGAGVGRVAGGGAFLAATPFDFRQGPLQATGVPTDLAIEGDGFFVVVDAMGRRSYTRGGAFQVDAEGRLGLPTSRGTVTLEPEIVIPADVSSLTIAADGTVAFHRPGSTSPETVGRLIVARFPNPEGLQAIGDNLFVETGASGEPVLEPFAGNLRQGFLEGSNVDVAEELVGLIENQRAFGLSARVIEAANQNLQTLTRLAAG